MKKSYLILPVTMPHSNLVEKNYLIVLSQDEWRWGLLSKSLCCFASNVYALYAFLRFGFVNAAAILLFSLQYSNNIFAFSKKNLAVPEICISRSESSSIISRMAISRASWSKIVCSL